MELRIQAQASTGLRSHFRKSYMNGAGRHMVLRMQRGSKFASMEVKGPSSLAFGSAVRVVLMARSVGK